MAKLVKSSLSLTLDSLNDDLFHGRKIPMAKKLEIAHWIAGRQGLKGSYDGLCAPTERDFTDGIRVFTGERMTSGAGTSHILGEEASRALLLLNVRDQAVREALERATAGFSARLRQTTSPTGMY